jgi:hypothetical protein
VTESHEPRRVLVAVDAGATDVAGAERLVAALDGVLPSGDPSYAASTHVVPGGRVAVVASWAGEAAADWTGVVTEALPDADLVGAAATEAAAQHRDRRAGRLARFAGQSALEAEVTVGEVLAGGVVEEVRQVGGGPLAPEATLDLREWVRPTWQAGRTVLLVQQSVAGLVPFESRHQIPCCADH